MSDANRDRNNSILKNFNPLKGAKMSDDLREVATADDNHTKRIRND